MPAIQTWTFAQIAIAVVIIAAIIALVIIALRKFKVSIPEWVIEVFWVIVVALVIVMAIKLVASSW